jgi:predicted nuclease of predicted toxin-antitoxin system
LAARLIQAGHEAEHVTRMGMHGVTDEAIWRHASRTAAVILSKDRDFADRAIGQGDGPSVVWIRIGNVTQDRLWNALAPRLSAIITAVEAGERLIEVQ